MNNINPRKDIPRCLKTNRLSLRCPQPQDGPALHAAVLDSLERLRPWFKWASEAKLTPERSTASARFAQWRFRAGRELQFYIFLRETEQLIGVCGLCHPDWSVPQFKLNYWLRTGYEGNGYMTEAITAVIDLAVEQLGAKRVELRCKPENKRSIALAHRCGLVRNGRLHVSGNASKEIVFSYSA